MNCDVEGDESDGYGDDLGGLRLLIRLDEMYDGGMLERRREEDEGEDDEEEMGEEESGSGGSGGGGCSGV
jgi:hypothetical protein